MYTYIQIQTAHHDLDKCGGIHRVHATHVHEPCHTHEWAMSHIGMSHVTRTNEPCHTYEWAMSHIRMNHVTHEWDIPHTWMSHTYACSCHTWISHFRHMNESRHTYERIMSHIWTSHVTHHIVTAHFDPGKWGSKYPVRRPRKPTACNLQDHGLCVYLVRVWMQMGV